jgi:hypothetical protein
LLLIPIAIRTPKQTCAGWGNHFKESAVIFSGTAECKYALLHKEVV